MDFARNLLLKYGWQEGKGLGKQESGISKPLKPKLKFNTNGLGFDPSEQFTHHWWEQAYNNAANNIDVLNTNVGDIAIKTLNNNSKIITKRTFISENEQKKLEYGSFKKVGLLKDKMLIEEAISGNKDSTKDESTVFKNLTDEELYLACHGRTGHKAARHGHKLNGKLARISNQDQMYSLITSGSDGKMSDCTVIMNRNMATSIKPQKIFNKIKLHTKNKIYKQEKETLESTSFEDCCEQSISQNKINLSVLTEKELCSKICSQDIVENGVEKVRKKSKSKKRKLSKLEENDEEFDIDLNFEHINNKIELDLSSKCYSQDNKLEINSKEINRVKIKKKRKKSCV